VNPKTVKELRELTGSPLKDCMKTLEETNGDIHLAKDLLRQRGLADAEKRSGRATSQGYIGVRLDEQNNKATMVQLLCETDFVAKTPQFVHAVESVLTTFHNSNEIEEVNKVASTD
jgi:elongation factor Ts